MGLDTRAGLAATQATVRVVRTQRPTPYSIHWMSRWTGNLNISLRAAVVNNKAIPVPAIPETNDKIKFSNRIDRNVLLLETPTTLIIAISLLFLRRLITI